MFLSGKAFLRDSTDSKIVRELILTFGSDSFQNFRIVTLSCRFDSQWISPILSLESVDHFEQGEHNEGKNDFSKDKEIQSGAISSGMKSSTCQQTNSCSNPSQNSQNCMNFSHFSEVKAGNKMDLVSVLKCNNKSHDYSLNNQNVSTKMTQ
jgi:hypothetical protein